MRTPQSRSILALGAIRVVEGLAFGVGSALILAGWLSRLNGDIHHGHLWLAGDRLHDVLPVGLGFFAVLSLGWGLALDGLRDLRRVPWYAFASLGAAVTCGVPAWFLGTRMVYEIGSRAMWSSRPLLTAGAASIALLTAGLLALRIADRRVVLARWRAGLAGVSAGAAVVFLVAFPSALAARADGRPSVILVSLDTLRADRVGFMGYGRPTTPRFDGFAAEGTVFERAASVAPWTLPAHASILTSLHPSEHRVIRLGQRLAPEQQSVAEILRDRGYRTAAFTGGGYVSAGSHFEQGFEVFAEYDEAKQGGPSAVAAGALAWVRGIGDDPYFLFIHTYEPHGPYTHTDFADARDRGRLREGTSIWDQPVDEATPAEKRYISDLYDGDILETDRAFGGFLDTLKKDRRLDRAVVVVTSDHGEDLWDHDALDLPRHGHSLYEEMLHVPLFVYAPSLVRGMGRVGTPVSMLDIVPTVLDLAGVPPHSGCMGVSLRRSLETGEEPAPRTLFAEGTRYGPARFALRDGDLKAILTPEPEVHVQTSQVKAIPLEVFDLANDPRELTDLSANPSSAIRDLVRALAERLSTRRTSRAADSRTFEIPPDLREQLRSLGYVD